MPAILRRFIATFRGGSIPTRCELTDGTAALVKMKGAGNGAESLVAEFLVNRIAHAAGFLVPDAFPLSIPENFPWAFGTDEFYDIVRKSFGLNLGLVWVDDARPLRLDELEALPTAVVAQIVTLDLIFGNVDRSAASSNLLRDHAGCIWLIDHGSCRFLQRPSGERQNRLHPGHVLAGREDMFAPELLGSVTRKTLDAIIAEIPLDWLSEARMDRDEVAKKVLRLFADE